MTPSRPAIDLRKYSCLFFDLDDTLYPRTSGIWELIRKRIDVYLIEVMDFSKDEVPELRHRLWAQYGTTLRGLQAEYNVDMADYLAFVHDVPIDSAIAPDPILEQSLANLPQRKFIFTNADKSHAQRVLQRLGIAPLFEDIIDIYAQAPHCKPQQEAFTIALRAAGTPPENCLMVDDAPRNLEAARSFGMMTVSIGEHIHDASPHIENIHDLFKLFL
jgi:putative hydrolase of the HAD superfamily